MDGNGSGWYNQRFARGTQYLAVYTREGTTFVHVNALQSSTMDTQQDGSIGQDVIFYPWGKLWASAPTSGFQFFAGIPDWDWDMGTGLTQARPYTIGQGRWLSPDPNNAGADPSNPQSWNAYSYAGNNPTTNTDPTGLYCVQDNNGDWYDDGNGGESCADAQASDLAEQQNPFTVTGQQGNAVEAVATNAFLALDNAANDFFAPLIGMRPGFMQNTPTGSGVAANVGAAVATLGMALIGPEGEASEAAQGGRRLLPLGEELSGRVSKTVEAADGGVQRFLKDGDVWINKDGQLPLASKGYYHEYTVDPIGGVSGRGAERIVVGGRGEVYYTPDHYKSFVRIR